VPPRSRPDLRKKRAMDLKKLKLDKFKNFQTVNFPDDIDPGIESTYSNVEVIIYFISRIEDVQRAVELAESAALPKENRVILVYEKGRKDGVDRDSIISPVKTGKVKGYKLRPPMLCSISDKLSAFVLSRES
jgi:hypothetical protein